MPPSPDGALISVMLVEDDVHFQNALIAAIARAPDIRLAALAGSRAQGLQALRGPPADVLLVDLGLPDGSGIDVIRAAHSLWPGCAVMVSTTFGDEAHVLQSIEAGASGYLLKDSAPEDMLDEIRTLHQGGSPISPMIARQILNRFRDRPAMPAPAAASASAFAQAQLCAPGLLPGPGVPEQAMLSSREMEVLQLITRGFTADEIARLLQVSSHTVQTYVRRIYSKLKVRSKAEAIYEARQQGILSA
ncbi:response regulator transcription factor [Polaromonas naphthalenivorans]|uniref:Two component transcriptional regulator, LuxR family n=1 Tax=Polaromonas naphthalenivorans (strain CJ2) TaxID=365044 RepID=A1VUP7_POLNA|nr:response regulator transcription factor [Polaromonas naphthalenivorans]ABM39375.1 two component transcriptional regulator, LuxR family [Polaromonas naphthalenivorans CJ2]